MDNASVKQPSSESTAFITLRHAYNGIKNLCKVSTQESTSGKTDATKETISHTQTTPTNPSTISEKKTGLLASLVPSSLKSRWNSLSLEERNSIKKVLKVALLATAVILGVAVAAAAIAALLSNPFTAPLGVLLLPVALIGSGILITGGLGMGVSILEGKESTTEKEKEKLDTAPAPQTTSVAQPKTDQLLKLRKMNEEWEKMVKEAKEEAIKEATGKSET